jgi:hypothetical protein
MQKNNKPINDITTTEISTVDPLIASQNTNITLDASQKIEHIELDRSNAIQEGVPEETRPISFVQPQPNRDASRPIQMVCVGQTMARLNAQLKQIDPDIDYNEWVTVLRAIHYETDGSEAGCDLADRWCQKGKKYSSIQEIETKWQKFDTDIQQAITVASLIKNNTDVGVAACDSVEPQSEPRECELDPPSEGASKRADHPLDRYSLRGQSQALEKLAVEQVPVLGQLALQGQATVFYAAPNTGKTLITLSLLLETMRNKKIDPSNIYYLNMDDSIVGLIDKLKIAEEYGFHMLADGHMGFKISNFYDIVNHLIENDLAHAVIILDTLKKFVNTMDKGRASGFTKIMRRFVMKGGTVIALAHTNKNTGHDGKVVYGGTSDIVDDFDCAYTITPIPSQSGSDDKVVLFENIKGRGNVISSAAYSYCTEFGAPYDEILSFVQPVDEKQLEPLKQAERIRIDSEVITVVETIISEDTYSKMKLADAVSKRAGINKRSAIQIIDKYTGTNPAVHKWTFSVRDRGAKVYELLNQAPS